MFSYYDKILYKWRRINTLSSVALGPRYRP